MFGEFLSIILKSIKLDKSLYSDSKNFGEASVYFAGIIMILDGIAGAVAANTVFKTAVAMSGQSCFGSSTPRASTPRSTAFRAMAAPWTAPDRSSWTACCTLIPATPSGVGCRATSCWPLRSATPEEDKFGLAPQAEHYSPRAIRALMPVRIS